MLPEIAPIQAIDQSGLGKRIREVRLSRKLTQLAFARSLGIVQGFLCGIERGKKVPSDTLLIALSHHYEIRLEWLITGSGEMAEPGQGRITGADNLIPLLKRVPDTFPDQVPESDIRTRVAFPDLPDDCFGLVYSGDFMSPTIRDGDIVLFRPTETVEPGMIVLFRNHWGEAMLRRYRVRNGEIHLSADNALYTPFKPDSTLRVLGVVVAVWRNIRI
ncbi:MAG TPA: XRE family transcriptional regulator [Desulfuromonadaceae bacterium]